MTKIDPIIAVKDVVSSSKWYQLIFDCKSTHGGSEFEILKNENNEILFCLHKWGEHDHPSMMNSEITPGNGLILYIRTKNFEKVRLNLKKLDYQVEKDIHLSPNSGKKEFSFIDINGYYITIADFHTYEG